MDGMQEIMEKEEGVRELSAVVFTEYSEESREELTADPDERRPLFGRFCRYLTMGYNWFCGYDYSPKGRMKLAEFKVSRRMVCYCFMFGDFGSVCGAKYARIRN